jgi:hypothetical protein
MAYFYLWNDKYRLDENRFPFTIYQTTAAYGGNKKQISHCFQFEFCVAPVEPRLLNPKKTSLFTRNFNYKIGGGYTQSIAFNTKVINNLHSL